MKRIDEKEDENNEKSNGGAADGLLCPDKHGGSAGKENDGSLEERLSTEREYIQSVLPGYLHAAQLQTDNAVVSENVTAADQDSQNVIMLVGAHERFAGVLIVAYLNGQYHSSFITGQSEIATAALYGEEPVSFYFAGNAMYICSEDGTDQLYGQDPIFSSEMSNLSFEELAVNEYSVESAPIVTVNRSVNLPYVYSGSCELSWVACVASVINYYNGTTYTASSLKNALESYYGTTSSCSDLWIGRGYNWGGLSCYHASGSSFYAEVIIDLLIDQNKPVLLQFSAGNVVACKSAEEVGNNIVLGWMDPWLNKTTFTTVASDCPDDIYYIYTNPYHYSFYFELTRIHHH